MTYQERRRNDEKNADIVTQFLEKYFYQPKTINYQHINDVDPQVKGIDSTFTLNNIDYSCDEKAAIKYINKHLQTFSLELSFINKARQLQEGWLLDKKKINNSFLFVWIDKAKKNNLTNIDDVQELEFALVTKNKIIEYLSSLNWTLDNLKRKAQRIREIPDESLGNLYKNGCKFSYSPLYSEKPINILLQRQTYVQLSDYHEKIII